jgi:hypothetical protein
MGRQHNGPKRGRRRPGQERKVKGHQAVRGQAVPQPVRLHHVDELALGTMAPADIILFSQARSLRSAVESVFFAILACPVCGTLGLVTASQYSGKEPVICGSKHCASSFRIDNKTRLVYLPVN